MKDITYSEWMSPMRQQQISVVVLLTAFLYFIYFIVDFYIVPKDSLWLSRLLHLYISVPFLLTISYLAHTNKYPKLVMLLVMIAPIFATVANLFINYYIDMSVVYFTEIFLIIFWIFTVSGLNLKDAMITSFIVSLITFLYLYFFSSYNINDTVMCVFWIFSSYSFGLVGAILMDRYSKEIYNNFIELKVISKTDKLTGLYNRAFVDKDFKVKFHFTQKNTNLAIVMIDIDDFKKINDTYGHHIGDSTLVQVSSIIKKYSDEKNIAVRWGGEEFIIISIDTNEETIIDLCENIRKDIESIKFDVLEKSTVSIGYSLSKNLDNFEQILNRADAALYTAKHNGKNCVESL